jgi:hypothetical protein
MGVRGIALAEGDSVISLAILKSFDAIPPERAAYLKQRRALRRGGGGSRRRGGRRRQCCRRERLRGARAGTVRSDARGGTSDPDVVGERLWQTHVVVRISRHRAGPQLSPWRSTPGTDRWSLHSRSRMATNHAGDRWRAAHPRRDTSGIASRLPNYLWVFRHQRKYMLHVGPTAPHILRPFPCTCSIQACPSPIAVMLEPAKDAIA